MERDAERLTGLLDDLAAPVAPALADATLVAKLTAQAALLRRESRGAHYRTDVPNTDPRWRGHILWRRDMPPSFKEIAQ